MSLVRRDAELVAIDTVSDDESANSRRASDGLVGACGLFAWEPDFGVRGVERFIWRFFNFLYRRGGFTIYNVK